MKKIFIAIFAMIFTLPELAFAHSGGTEGAFMSGLGHPVLGLDHLLAMLSVGILSAQMGGRSIWSVPLTFVIIMLLGGVLGMNDIPVFSVELGIAISVILLGIAIASEKKLVPLLAMLFVGIFAIFHGHAHGTEMPYLAEPALYTLGFITGTISIHILGVLISYILQKLKYGEQVLRFLGAGIAGIGVYLLSM
ncbi:HupE/UreJ family protein [Psychromonas sp. KJ10-10]|uniref:HupE/UreJ family protein n=1 Tax=Psychromonas sp. KJ10-10 TaxID=3391823 RepID=UPI0039B53B0D